MSTFEDIVLDQLHASAVDIPFEPRYVEQLHGYLYRFTRLRQI